MLDQFLGGTVGPIVTPPLDAYGNPLTLPVTAAPTTAQSSAPATTAQTAPPGATTNTVPPSSIPPYDPRPC